MLATSRRAVWTVTRDGGDIGDALSYVQLLLWLAVWFERVEKQHVRAVEEELMHTLVVTTAVGKGIHEVRGTIGSEERLAS